MILYIIDKQGEKPEPQNREPSPPNPANNMKRARLLCALEPHHWQRVTLTLNVVKGRGTPTFNYDYSPYITLLCRGCYSVHNIGIATWDCWCS